MKTIAWDVDDVLNDLMRSWFDDSWRPSHLDCLLDYDGIVENPPHELLCVSMSEYLISLDSFRFSEAIRKMRPVPEVITWFHQHGERFRHIALTATPLRAAPLSSAWVMHHFGKWIRSFNVIPSKRQSEQIPIYDQSKEEFLRWFGRVDILVDDSPVNVAEAQTLGIQAILLPRPWNQSPLTLVEALNVLATLADTTS
ncbi:MAG: hypothetical protein HOC20_12390 [Chloroflexi bacterium]|nr:hypothetical protein [Chloroflexota bacterium]